MLVFTTVVVDCYVTKPVPGLCPRQDGDLQSRIGALGYSIQSVFVGTVYY